MSVYGDILAMCETKLKALNLAGIATNVHVQKLPGAEEEIDTLPMIAVVPADTDPDFRRASFENQAELSAPVEMVVITKGKKLIGATGNTATSDDLYTQAGWQERIAKTFYDSQTLGVAGLWQTEISPGKPVDRGKVNQNYDYIPVTVRFRVMTQGTN